jgi:TadE-like protein
MPDKPYSHRSIRRGSATMELMLVLPVLLTLLVGLFEFSVLFVARSAVVDSAREGARAASRWEADPLSVEQEVRRVLAPSLQRGLIVEVEPGVQTGDTVTVIVRVPMRSASPDLLWGAGLSLDGRYLIGEATMIKE